MKILTKDNRLLTLCSIGKADIEVGSDKITCRDENGKKVIITWSDVALAFGSYTITN
jgi:hypothetical protein